MMRCLVLLITILAWSGLWAQYYPNLVKNTNLVVKRGFSKEALQCIECHTKKTPGIVLQWKESRMAHAGVSCYDCHVVPKSSPMASQCDGIRGTNIYISPMVSPKTCAKCHPTEVEQFTKSAHARLASRPVIKLVKLEEYYEGGQFAGLPKGDPRTTATRRTGCQMCHGAVVKLGPDKKPVAGWPGGIGTRYPDGGIGNCVACHYRHKFSIEQARKPDTCGRCHLGPDHPDIEIYLESAHGQLYLAHGEKWKWDSAPDTWEPGDYEAPTCAVCHMSGIGDLKTTHNVGERLYWDLMHKKSMVRGTEEYLKKPFAGPERGFGPKGRELMMKVCENCHSTTHTKNFFKKFDDAVKLYNFYYDKVVAMLKDLKSKGLLKKDPWSDAFQELYYYFWHHTGRRARQGAAMDAPDYAHWHGFFQMFQVYKDMQAIYNWRIKHNKIEELSPVMSSAPY